MTGSGRGSNYVTPTANQRLYGNVERASRHVTAAARMSEAAMVGQVDAVVEAVASGVDLQWISRTTGIPVAELAKWPGRGDEDPRDEDLGGPDDDGPTAA